jgi:hypothetical protein
MIASVHVVFPALAVLVFLAFLVLLAVLGKMAASATRGPADGGRGCLGGCGLFVVILAFCALGVAGFVAFVLALTGVAAVEHNPIKSVEVIWPDAVPGGHGEPGSRRRDAVPVLLRVTTEGEREDAIRRIRAILERRLDVDDRVLDDLRTTTTAEGTVIELRFPVDRRDLEEVRRELQAWGVEVGEGVRVVLEVERGV